VDIKLVGIDGLYWIYVVQDRTQWWTLVVTIRKLWVAEKVRNLLTS